VDECNPDGNSWSTTACGDPQASVCMGAGICTPVPEWKVNGYSTSGQSWPAAAVVGGKVVVAWQSLAQDGNDYGVYLKLFDDVGTELVGETQANLYTTGAQQHPAIAALGNDLFFLGWESGGQDGSGLGLFGRSFTLDGLGSAEMALSAKTADIQEQLFLLPLDAGGAITVWEDQISGSGRIFGGRLTPAGWVKNGGQQATMPVSASDSRPAAVMVADNKMIVAWQRKKGALYDVYMRSVENLAGLWSLGQEAAIAADVMESEKKPAVLATGSEILTGWIAEGSGEACVAPFLASLQPAGLKKCIEPTIGAVLSLALAPSSSGKAVAVWQEGGGATHKLHFARLDDTLSVTGDKVIAEGSLDPDAGIAVVSLGTGKYLVVWAADAALGTGLDVYARFVQLP
jgi:hypothetical protein